MAGTAEVKADLGQWTGNPFGALQLAHPHRHVHMVASQIAIVVGEGEIDTDLGMALHKVVEQLAQPALGEVDGGGETDLAAGLMVAVVQMLGDLLQLIQQGGAGCRNSVPARVRIRRWALRSSRRMVSADSSAAMRRLKVERGMPLSSAALV